MNNNRPMRIPAIGGGPMQPGIPAQQPQKVNISIGPNDIIFKPCEQCGYEFFDVAYRPGIMSSVNPKNPSGKDILLKTDVLLCRGCGWEYGKQMEIKQQKGE